MHQFSPKLYLSRNQLFAKLARSFSLLYLSRKVPYHISKSRDGTKLFWRAIARGLAVRQLQCVWIVLASFALNGCSGTLLLDASESSTSLNQLTMELAKKYPVIGVSEGLGEQAVLVDGEDALIFQLMYGDGLTIDSSNFRGQPILLNFWATWCSPCRREMPDIVAQSGANGDLVVIAINEMEAVEQIQPFVEEFQMEMIVARDINGEIGKIFGLGGVPKSIFIDRNGHIVSSWPGYLSAERLQELLSRIL